MTNAKTAIVNALRVADTETETQYSALAELAVTVRDNLSVMEAHERANGYAAGREDASDVKTVPAPDSWRGPDHGWMDFADAFAQAQDDYNHGLVGMMTNCKAAYERWTETGGRTVHDAGTRIRTTD